MLWRRGLSQDSSRGGDNSTSSVDFPGGYHRRLPVHAVQRGIRTLPYPFVRVVVGGCSLRRMQHGSGGCEAWRRFRICPFV